MHTKKPNKLKVFLLAFIPIFLIVALPHIGIKPPKIHLNSTTQILNSQNAIRSKLREKINDFKLKKQAHIIPQSFAASADYNLSAYAVVDYDTGDILAEKASSKRLPIASLTKIMTAVVALDLTSSSDIFTASKKASRIEPTRIGVSPSQKLVLEDLLHALLLTSANDAAEVIREGIDKKYNQEVFIEAMNQKAELLGLSDTSFDNPQGFDGKENYSTASDMAILSHYALEKYPLITAIAKKDYQLIYTYQGYKRFDLYNWNGLLGVYPGIIGLKIGNTDDAGNTTIVVSEREGKKILVVALGAEGVLNRDLLAAELLDVGFEKTLGLTPIAVDKLQLQAKYDTWQYWN